MLKLTLKIITTLAKGRLSRQGPSVRTAIFTQVHTWKMPGFSQAHWGWTRAGATNSSALEEGSRGLKSRLLTSLCDQSGTQKQLSVLKKSGGRNGVPSWTHWGHSSRSCSVLSSRVLEGQAWPGRRRGHCWVRGGPPPCWAGGGGLKVTRRARNKTQCGVPGVPIKGAYRLEFGSQLLS